MLKLSRFTQVLSLFDLSLPLFSCPVFTVTFLLVVTSPPCFISVDPANHSQHTLVFVHSWINTHTHTHMRDGVLRHGDVEAIAKVIEFLTFVTTTSVFDKTLLHYSAACVGGCFSFFPPTLVCV